MNVLLVKTASLTGFPELVRELGGQPESLMKQVGLDLSLFDDPEQMMSSETLSELFDLSAKALNCPCFGLLLSQRQGLSILGPVGLIMRQSPTFYDAIMALQKYIHLRSEAGTFSLEVDQGIAIIKYTASINGVDHSRQVTDLSLGIGCHLMRLYIGEDWNPRAVYFQHTPAPDLSPYNRIFHAPISFQQEFSGLVFDARILQATIGSFEPEMQQFLGQYLDDQERTRKPEFIHQVSLIIEGLLPKGQCSLQAVAHLLGLKERSLQRRLKREATTFQRVLDQARQSIAQQYLKTTATDLTVLAQLLGYADLSIFSKAFKKWFGISPSQYK
jgi:AraC-like DNA-binding protein